jgi:hypothetical protein
LSPPRTPDTVGIPILYPFKAGVSYTRPKSVSHNVINANSYEFRFVEIELK